MAYESPSTGRISRIFINDPGENYTTITPVIYGDGGGYNITAVLRDGVIRSIPVTAGGSGYTDASVTLSGIGGGTGFEAAVIISNGEVTEVRITDPGEGYDVATTATITGTGSGATLGTVSVADGGLRSITVNDGGSGYSATPIITFTGDGDGAIATVFLNIVEEVDFNTFRAEVNNVLGDNNFGKVGVDAGGVGYLNAPIDRTVDVGDIVTAPNEWQLLILKLNDLRIHQTGVSGIPIVDLPYTTGIIRYLSQLEDEIQNAYDDRFLLSDSQAIIGEPLNNTDSLREDPWDGEITHEIRAVVNSWNELRQFFNTGGEIRMTPYYDNNNIQQGSIEETWDNLISEVGTVAISADAVTNTGSGGTLYTNGFYDFTTSMYGLIYSHSIGDEQLDIYFALNADNTPTSGIASGVYMKMVLSSANDGVPITGNTGNRITRKVSSFDIIAPDPTFTKTIDFTAGGEPTPPLSATLTVNDNSQSCEVGATCPNDFVITMNVAEALGSLSYAWSIPNNGGNDFNIITSNPSTKSTITVRSAASVAPTDYNATVQCIATDAGRGDFNTVEESVTIASSSISDAPPIFISEITDAPASPIYEVGDSQTVSASPLSCTYNIANDEDTCTNTWTLTATVSGYDVDNITGWTWTKTGSAFSVTPSGSGATRTATVSATSDDPVFGQVTLTVTSANGGSDSVIIDFDSSHGATGDQLGGTISGGGTKQCTYTGSSNNCAVTFNLTAVPTGGVPPFSYAWSSSDTVNYPLIGAVNQSTATVTTPAGRTNLASDVITCTVTDSAGTPVSFPITSNVTANRRPSAITNATITRASGNNTCTYSRDGTPSANFNSSAFCKDFVTFNSSVTGGSGSYNYAWSLTNISPTGKASFANSVNDSVDPGDTTATSTNVGVLTTNNGVTPNTSTRTNAIAYRLSLTITDQLSNAVSPTNNTASTNRTSNHNDVTTTIAIGNINSNNGSCQIATGNNSCQVVTTHTVPVNAGNPGSFTWTFVSNPSNKFSFQGNGSTSSYTSSSNTISIVSTLGQSDGVVTGTIRVTANKTGQPGKTSSNSTFTHTMAGSAPNDNLGLGNTYQDQYSGTQNPSTPAQISLSLYSDGTGRILRALLPNITYVWIDDIVVGRVYNYTWSYTNLQAGAPFYAADNITPVISPAGVTSGSGSFTGTSSIGAGFATSAMEGPWSQAGAAISSPVSISITDTVTGQTYNATTRITALSTGL